MKITTMLLLLASVALGTSCGPSYPFIDNENRIDRFEFNLAIARLPNLGGCWQETHALKDRRFIFKPKVVDNDDVFSVFAAFQTAQDYGGGSSHSEQGISHMVGRLYELRVTDNLKKTTAYYLFDQAEDQQFLMIPSAPESSNYTLKDAVQGVFTQIGKRLTLIPKSQAEPHYLFPCIPHAAVNSEASITQTLAGLYSELMAILQAAAESYELFPIDGLAPELNAERHRAFALTQPPEHLNNLLGLTYRLLHDKLSKGEQTTVQAVVFKDLIAVLNNYALQADVEWPQLDQALPKTNAPGELQDLHRTLQVLMRHKIPLNPE